MDKKWLLVLIYTSLFIENTSIHQHLKQQGTIILPVFNFVSLANPPNFGFHFLDVPIEILGREPTPDFFSSPAN
ncbi:hypothetical protein VF14_12440 [Nostoc linckia z18]|jgi:hypothetical protein|uniref:Uncharacterized protein n=2 Tax=Nostoc linckia TaxID=92942 RepID=A0A9Q6EJN4_NOSLI|nr:hypothetical protein VF05_24230 [Nostoc linckia z3]PHJ65515.1 hypothetical protein VF02_10530 [Nostoc linckia z1]PHJ76998.1 hypothetical protein VF03_05870 [Nostoc linckia z2]PHJ81909.1 hypothetical protein VF06_17905 [Nostoc linckia z4]PHJ89421.1 hypothetical protein VF07_12675 [Nostoc linckia z6]PHJ99895.1 hypothetical protein VF08_24970 [Nostoc linckia z8]PHK00923.1 hypothetical protein VF04_01685 [Nostoc linckia z7]PHK10661.1 hypothetical protein VF09_10575 [Nostoc linckia z9]PHK1965